MKNAAPKKTNWPTKEGWYWFFGYPYGKEDGDQPEWNMVQVRMLGTGKNESIAYIRNGHFWYQEEKGIGVFFPASMPATPDLTNLIQHEHRKTSITKHSRGITS